jgi:acetylglutamate/LysW-gamma-L-alpha-aminoadipate kinase
MLVVKVGGGRGIGYEPVCDDLAALHARGCPWLLVHGGSHETNELAKALGHPPRFVTSASGYESRYTDRRTLEIFEMAYCGKVNKGIVELLQRRGVPAIGLAGLDGRLLSGPRKATLTIVEGGKKKVLRDDHTGTITSVNTELIRVLYDAGYVLAVCPPAISDDHVAVNVDGDRAAARLADAVGADDLVILSNVPGLLRDPDDESSLIRHIVSDALDGYVDYAKGRMRKKLMAVKEALAGGVRRVVLGDARLDQPVTAALAGRGTIIAASGHHRA